MLVKLNFGMHFFVLIVQMICCIIFHDKSVTVYLHGFLLYLTAFARYLSFFISNVNNSFDFQYNINHADLCHDDTC